jgi:hypothetical protein
LPLAKAVTPREVTDRVHIFATNFAHLVEKAKQLRYVPACYRALDRAYRTSKKSR